MSRNINRYSEILTPPRTDRNIDKNNLPEIQSSRIIRTSNK
jgi:hypothetical protein